MRTLQQLPELSSLITALDNVRFNYENEIAGLQTAFEALSEASADDYEPQNFPENALAYIARNTTVGTLLLAKANYATALFVEDVRNIINAIEAHDET